MGFFGVWVVILLVCLGEIQVGLGGRSIKNYQPSTNRYISWGDVKLDTNEKSLDFRDESSRRKIIVVDQNGNGDSLTVKGAVDMVPDDNLERVKIYILPGIYREKVLIPNNKPHVSFIGDQNRAAETVITWNDKASNKGKDGRELTTYGTATVAIESDFFCASWITFENSVVAKGGIEGEQAVALRITGDKAMFYGVRFLGSQDTLLDDHGSHYFYQCYIQGYIDFIFGMAKSLYQDCVIHSTAEGYGAIAAHGRDSPNEDTGFSFVNCKISGSGKVDLGRAWGNYSRTIYAYCDIDDIINPSGWSNWDTPSKQETAVFGEFNCRGKGAIRTERVPWTKSLSYVEVKPFLGIKYINGGDQWLRL